MVSFFVILICISFYGIFLLITYTFLSLLKYKFTKKSFLLPLIPITATIILLSISNLISTGLYTFINYILMIIFGFCLYLFFTCIIYLLISRKFTFKPLNVIIVLLSIPFTMTLYGVINANVIRIETITLPNEHLLQNTVIAHLSDIHIGPLFQKGTIESIVSIVTEMNPDVIVITGDMVDGHIDINGEWLEPLNAVNKPILFVSGNHEKYFGKERFITMLKEHTHIMHLSNSTITYNGVNFIGVDYEYNLKDMLNYIMKEDTSLRNENAVNVLLNHVPLLKTKELEEFNLFLNLAGHTHAGQFFPLQIFAYFGNVLYNGLYSYNDKHYAYVSSGIGANTIPMRVLSKSKIVKVNLINPNINTNNNNNNSIIIS